MKILLMLAISVTVYSFEAFAQIENGDAALSGTQIVNYDVEQSGRKAVIINNPRILGKLISADSSSDGVCKYFHFRNALDVYYRKFDTGLTSLNTDNDGWNVTLNQVNPFGFNHFVVVVPKQGFFDPYHNRLKYKYIETLVCE